MLWDVTEVLKPIEYFIQLSTFAINSVFKIPRFAFDVFYRGAFDRCFVLSSRDGRL